MAKKITPIEEIVRRIKEIHGDNITIVESTYKKYSDKATFIHKIHGEWTTGVRHVLEGRTHKKEADKNKTTPLEFFVGKLKEMHDSKVSMVESTYRGGSKMCTFVHSEYGNWESTPNIVINLGCNNKKIFIERLTLKKEVVEKRIFDAHGSDITIVWESYTGTNKKCLFDHKVYGRFKSTPASIFIGCGPVAGSLDKARKTCMVRYGVENSSQNREISLKMAKSQTNSVTRNHWKTGEELVCQASWEPKVVDYLNNSKMDYLWQSEVFVTPLLTKGGKNCTYRPDLFLIEENKWVEIKGFFRKDALEKWNWFKTQFPTAELWDQKKLKEMGIL